MKSLLAFSLAALLGASGLEAKKCKNGSRGNQSTNTTVPSVGPASEPVPALSELSCNEKINSVSFQVKGDIGETIPSERENLKIRWINSEGKERMIVSKLLLTTNWTSFSVQIPAQETLGSLSFSFLNDKVWYIKNTRMDRNIYLDMLNFQVNGKKVNVSNTIKSANYDRFVAQKDYARASAIPMGKWYWGGDYRLDLNCATTKQVDLDESFDQFEIYNISLKVKGDVGGLMSGKIEPERISVSTLDHAGKITTWYSSITLGQQWSDIKLEIPSIMDVKRVIIKYLNDEIKTINGKEYDKNVKIHPIMEVNDVPVNINKRIGGPVYDSFKNDAVRRQAIVDGTLAWSGEYWITL